MNRDLLSRLLLRDAHAVEVAQNGKEALAKLRQSEFDLVLLDLLMPEVDGFQVLGAIRQDSELRNVAVIVVSALDDFHSAVRSIELGAEDYLSKPIDTVLLRARVGASLERKGLRDLEKKIGGLFRRALSVFVDQRVASSLEESQSLSLSGTRQFVSVLVSDIRGFTAFCEAKDPAVVVSRLNSYLAQMVSIIRAHHGYVNKFIGDGILAVFSDQDGTQSGDHVVRAVRCGMAMVTAPTEFCTRAGVSTGAVVIGNIGSAEKMEYTVLGDAVNIASRLEALNEEQETSILISPATHALLENQIETVCLGAVPVRGRVEPIQLYTVTSLAPQRAASGAAAGAPVTHPA